MTFFLPLDLAQQQLRTASFKDALQNVAPLIVLAGAAYLALCRWTEEAARKARESHLRGERLAAYRARHRWKTSDVRPLLSIGVNKAAKRRMAALKGKGRPVVKLHQPLEDILREKLTTLTMPFREDATPIQRRRSFRQWPWWKHYVEALYRGELERARAKQIKGPHDCAERAIAAALRVSQGTVHAICGEVRAIRRDDAEAADFPPMVLTDYEQWMEGGELPKRLATK